MRLGAPEMPLPFASPTDPAVGRRHRLARRGQRRRGYPRERAVILSSGPRLTVPLAHLARRSTPAAQGESTSTLEGVERAHITRVLEEMNWMLGGPRGRRRTPRDEAVEAGTM